MQIGHVAIRDALTTRPLTAELWSPVAESDFAVIERIWPEWLSRHGVDPGESGHWNWRRKLQEWYADAARYVSVAIRDGVAAEATQGLMLVDRDRPTRHECEPNKSLVYIEYLEVAPWNRSFGGSSTQRYRDVGTALILVAIELSQQWGHEGRIGLHSLPQANRFYRRFMRDFGLDPAYGDLRYFELSGSELATFLARGPG